MKIALLHYASPPIVGGVESVMAHHARLMAAAGHQVTILTGRGASFDERIRVRVLPRLDSRHVQVLAVKAQLDQGMLPPGFDALRSHIESDLWAELQGFDILIAHNVVSLHKNLPLTAALQRIYQKPGFPRLILWHHDLAWNTPRYDQELHPGYPWDLLRSNWQDVRHVVVSQVRQTELGSLLGLPEASIGVIPNGVDLNAFYKLETQTVELLERLELIGADPLFLLPVRLTPRKNIELALRVLAALRERFPKARLLITGPEGPHNPANAAYKKKLLSLREELGLGGAVHFLAEVVSGFVPDAVVADFYRLADALLFPSREEGFGIPIIEAAFSGMPVFCSDIPVLRELGGDDVSYFDPDAAPGTIADQIAARMNGEMTLRWARRTRHAYTWKMIYQAQIEPLLREVMS